MGEEPNHISTKKSDPIKYTAKKGGEGRSSKSYNSFTVSYENTKKKKTLIQRILNDV